MKNYFTFFLCSRDWGHVEETVLPVIQKLVDALPSSGKIQASAHLKSSSPAIVSGTYKTLRKKLQPQDLVRLILQVPGQTPGVQEFSLFFENTRYQYTPEYLRFVFPRGPEKIEARIDLKIFSFSVAYELFRRGLIDAQRELLERLFVDANCVYGFGHPTTWPITGPSQFIRDNSSQAGRQIVDFDYDRHIEDVYRYNYLSLSHLREIVGSEEMCRTPGVECKQLFDETQQPHGLAVYLQDDLHTHAVIAKYLRNLIPAAGDSSKSFQLLLSGELDPALKDELDSYSFTAAVNELPDFIRVAVALREPDDVQSNQQFFADLTDFFERVRPGIAWRSQGIAQLLVQYPGFFEPGQIIQRVPYRRLEHAPNEGDHVKVYFTSNARSERLKISFLLNPDVKSERDRKLVTLISEWLAALDRHPDVYGTVKTIEELSPLTIENKTHAQMLVDTTSLRQDGFNLLILMLDHLNRSDLIVRYVVCGELPQSF